MERAEGTPRGAFHQNAPQVGEKPSETLANQEPIQASNDEHYDSPKGLKVAGGWTESRWHPNNGGSQRRSF